MKLFEFFSRFNDDGLNRRNRNFALFRGISGRGLFELTGRKWCETSLIGFKNLFIFYLTRIFDEENLINIFDGSSSFTYVKNNNC